jgi:hypothetical protein
VQWDCGQSQKSIEHDWVAAINADTYACMLARQ